MWKKSVFSHSTQACVICFRRQYRRAILSRGYFTIFCGSIFHPSPIRVPHTAHTQKSAYQPSTSSPLSPLLSPPYPPSSPQSLPSISPPHFPSLTIPKSKNQRNFAINHNINKYQYIKSKKPTQQRTSEKHSQISPQPISLIGSKAFRH